MIQDDAQYLKTKQAIAQIESALSALRQRVEPANPELFRAMAQSYLATIDEMRAEIDQYIGVSSAAEARAPLWLTLVGERLNASEVSSRLLSDWLTKMRKSLQTVAEYIDSGRILTGRPTVKLIELTDPKIVALARGSIKIGLRLPSPPTQGVLFESTAETPQPLALRAMARILAMVEWVDSEQRDLSRNQFPDPTEASILADQVSSLVPSRRSSVQMVKFSGAIVPSPSALTVRPEALPKLRRIISELTETHIDSVEGVIREIDLDAQRIILRERGPETPDIKCYLPDDLVEVAEQLLDRQVRVTGRFSSATPDTVDVTSIEGVGAG